MCFDMLSSSRDGHDDEHIDEPVMPYVMEGSSNEETK